MPDVTVKTEDEFETYFLGSMSKVRSGLGVTSFGMQIMRLPAHEGRYPEHDHTESGQEEVYVVLEGEATLTVGGEDHPLKSGSYARVGPAEKRKITTGDSAVKILALGGSPGKAYEVVEFTNEGAPDPLAG